MDRRIQINKTQMYHQLSLKNLFLILLFTLTSTLFAQEKMIAKDGKEYLATTNWKFSCKDYTYTGLLEVQIGKAEKGGLLRLGVDVSNETFYIGDTVYLILEDGSYITCTDKGLRELKGKTAIAYYVLTSAEVNKLKTLPLTDVRFRIKGKQDNFSSKTGHFTAKNQKSRFETFGASEEENKYDTKNAIKILYQ